MMGNCARMPPKVGPSIMEYRTSKNLDNYRTSDIKKSEVPKLHIFSGGRRLVNRYG